MSSVPSVSSGQNDVFYKTVNKSTHSIFTAAKTAHESQYEQLKKGESELIDFQKLFNREPDNPCFSQEGRFLKMTQFEQTLSQAQSLADVLINLKSALDAELHLTESVSNVDLGVEQQKTKQKTEDLINKGWRKIVVLKANVESLHRDMKSRLDTVKSSFAQRDKRLEEEYHVVDTPKTPLHVLRRVQSSIVEKSETSIDVLHSAQTPILTLSNPRIRDQEFGGYSLFDQMRECSSSPCTSSSSSSSLSSSSVYSETDVSSPSFTIDPSVVSDLHRRNNEYYLNHLESSELDDSGLTTNKNPEETDEISSRQVKPDAEPAISEQLRRAQKCLDVIDKHLKDLDQSYLRSLERLQSGSPSLPKVAIPISRIDQNTKKESPKDKNAREDDPLAAMPLTKLVRIDSKPRTSPKTSETPSRKTSLTLRSPELRASPVQRSEGIERPLSRRTRFVPISSGLVKVTRQEMESGKPPRVCGGSWASCTGRTQYVKGLEDDERDVQDLDNPSKRTQEPFTCILL